MSTPVEILCKVSAQPTFHPLKFWARRLSSEVLCFVLCEKSMVATGEQTEKGKSCCVFCHCLWLIGA